MATNKPRLILSLRPGLYETIKRLAQYEGRPMSRVVSELLYEIEPMLQSTVAALDQVHKAKGRPAAALATAVTRMQEAVERLSEKATGQLDLLRLEASGRGADAPAAATPPPAKPRRKAVKGRKRARGG